MNSERKTTRKGFLKLSALAAAGGACLVGNCIFGRRTNAPETTTSPKSLTAMSGIRPAQETVVRKSI